MSMCVCVCVCVCVSVCVCVYVCVFVFVFVFGGGVEGRKNISKIAMLNKVFKNFQYKWG